MPDEPFVPNTHQAQAMEALFQLTEAVSGGELSIGDLIRVVRFAVADGHDQMVLVLQMASQAVTMAQEQEN